MLYAFVLLCLFGSAFAGCITSPSVCCPKLETVKNFDAEKYTGLWYTQRAIRPTEEGKEKCYIMEYDLDKNQQLTLSASEISRYDLRTFENGTTRVPDPSDPGKLTYTIFGESVGSDYWILGTDYESYAVTYGCYTPKGQCNLFVTILTREVNPPQSVINEALKLAERNNIDKSRFYENEPILCEKEFVESRVTECTDEFEMEEVAGEETNQIDEKKKDESFWCRWLPNFIC